MIPSGSGTRYGCMHKSKKSQDNQVLVVDIVACNSFLNLISTNSSAVREPHPATVNTLQKDNTAQVQITVKSAKDEQKGSIIDNEGLGLPG
jgi:Tfp pilus assembly PilM family ATPase